MREAYALTSYRAPQTEQRKITLRQSRSASRVLPQASQGSVVSVVRGDEKAIVFSFQKARLCGKSFPI